jgi:signal peptidase I
MSLPARKSTAREYFESIVIAVILALFIRTWVVQAFKIPTGSMEQNLLIGDHLLVNKFVFGPARGGVEEQLLPVGRVERADILVFKFPDDPERDFIKRVIGLPGEMLEVRRKQVYIDGNPLDEPYLRPEAKTLRAGATPVDGRDNYGPVTIPDGHYFMMGDNRDNSQDSRYWGPLPHGHLKGKAMMIYWSYDAGPPVISSGGGWGIRRFASGVGRFFTGTRWDRMFRQVG